MAELPAGTVTLLFTDVEGSTRLLQKLGRDRYVAALTEHRRLLREAFAGHGGVEVEMQGDSFHFAFTSARDSVAAAAEAQRALAAYAWESEPIWVKESFLDTLRERVDTDAFDEAWRQGAEPPVRDAVNQALRDRG